MNNDLSPLAEIIWYAVAGLLFAGIIVTGTYMWVVTLF